MNKKPIIGIVGRRSISILNRDIYHVEDNYRRAILRSGGIPIIILPTQDVYFPYDTSEKVPALNEEEKQDLYKQVDLCDGILVPGGFRIFESDKVIIKYAMEKNLPILGICLGMQEIVATDAGDKRVIGNVETGVNHKSDLEEVHKVKVDKSSLLYKIVLNDEFIVNSKHRMCIKETNFLDIVAYSEDGIIEAVEDKEKKFLIGVQWHPECMIDKSKEAKNIFDNFIQSAKI